MTLTHMRCPYCHGKSIEPSAPTPFNVVNPGPCIIVPPVHGLFRNPPYSIAQLKTPIALVVQVLAPSQKGRYQRCYTAVWCEQK